MTTKQERLQNRLGPEIQEFKQQCQTIQIASLTDNLPHVSYAPFICNETGYYILISDLAQHGQNLKRSKHVSIMMIEDESSAKSVHARKRLTFDTIAQHIEKQSPLGQRAIKELIARFGELVENLSQLGDFNLYQLTPQQGRYVKGFGQAFNVSGDEMLDIIHLTEGHVKEMKDKEIKEKELKDKK
ncbi:heme utilization protein HutZ [Vibrio sp. SS-MA-C1-2]|uniref:heme utilization protein HutZ n=1 Tax=Vibrio sp. SS-MA-C1-2 TaxID=2908646 RepID=UPI001F263917|nr:heme utilization protein HutZ [Vibrio sp. SS-MA-C1-2]UJF17338.1 heme utilization protein HutZ [Vibrio sp. SS-MA-C1-2]